MNARLAALAAGVLLLTAVLVAGCAGGGGTPSKTAPAESTGGSGTSAAPAGGTTMVEQDFTFEPSSLTVRVGDTVTFENKDSVDHQVFVADTDLGTQGPGETVTWTAKTAGDFPVRCQLHPSMTGDITVK